MEDDQLILLLKKYLDGNCSPSETQLVESWYAAQKDEQAVFYRGNEAQIELSSAKSLQTIQDRIAQQQVAPVDQPIKKRLTISAGWMAIAASILLFLVSGLYLYQSHYSTSAVKYREIAAGHGQVIHVILADHTSVWLNACSRLKYPVTLKGERREVYLEGEAYFDVFHNPSKPFLVHTSGLTTTVLGTAFSVTAYKNMHTQSVTVIRGKVQVADPQAVLGFLTPNRKLTYNLKSRKGEFSGVQAAAYMSWKDGRLQFEDQDIEDIAARLSRWYGYDFRFDLPLKNRHYTASFNNRIPLDNLLAVIRSISGINYKINNTAKSVTFLGSERNQ